MLDRRVLRVGGGAAMAGAALGLIFNLLHPRSAEALDSAAAELELVTGSDMWLFIHLMLAVSLLLALIAVVVIGRSFPEEPAASWGLLGVGAGIASAAVMSALVPLDGIALERLAAAGNVQGVEILQAIDAALLTWGTGMFFGLTPILLSVAMLSSVTYPRWLAYLGLLGGALALLTAVVQWFTGLTTFTLNGMYLVSSIAITVWFFIAGMELWKRREVPVPVAHATGPPPT